MFIFYLFACIPVIVGFFLWWKDEKVIWQEWLIGSACAFLFTGIFHLFAITGMTSDKETWSGKITRTLHYGQWVEEYEQEHTMSVPCGSDSKGNVQYQTITYYTTEHATHPERWTVNRNFGSYDDEIDVGEDFYREVVINFGNNIDSINTQRCTHGGHYDGGDNKIYITQNSTGYLYPVTSKHRFENRIKAAPSVFSFISVPTNIPVFNYPENKNWLVSDRLLGRARRDFNINLWDKMNSRLGPIKRVNVIMVGFDNEDSMIAEYQRAKWIGGKKNDLVLVYGQGWSRVFGWTESEIVKENLQTILLNNIKNDDLIPLIEGEIKINYKIKDWSKFDYLQIEPRTSHYIWFIVLTVLTQSGLYLGFHFNDLSKINNYSSFNFKRMFNHGYFRKFKFPTRRF